MYFTNHNVCTVDKCRIHASLAQCTLFWRVLHFWFAFCFFNPLFFQKKNQSARKVKPQFAIVGVDKLSLFCFLIVREVLTRDGAVM